MQAHRGRKQVAFAPADLASFNHLLVPQPLSSFIGQCIASTNQRHCGPPHPASVRLSLAVSGAEKHLASHQGAVQACRWAPRPPGGCSLPPACSLGSLLPARPLLATDRSPGCPTASESLRRLHEGRGRRAVQRAPTRAVPLPPPVPARPSVVPAAPGPIAPAALGHGCCTPRLTSPLPALPASPAPSLPCLPACPHPMASPPPPGWEDEAGPPTLPPGTSAAEHTPEALVARMRELTALTCGSELRSKRASTTEDGWVPAGSAASNAACCNTCYA